MISISNVIAKPNYLNKECLQIIGSREPTRSQVISGATDKLLLNNGRFFSQCKMPFDTFLLLLLTCLNLSQPLPSIAITSAESRIIFSHIFCLKIQSYSKVILFFCLKSFADVL